MDDLCPILGFLLIALLFVTLIGHGIWVLLGTLVRGIRKELSAQQTARAAEPHSGETELVVRRLNQLHREGKIDVAVLSQVTTALLQEQSSLTIGSQIFKGGSLEGIKAANGRLVSGPENAVILEEAALQEASAVLRQSAPAVAAPLPPLPIPVIQIETDEDALHSEPPPPPRRPASAILTAFMEESNIRWGELVGGLLIVGCSIALVITFWQQIAAWQWFRFLVFTAIASGIFGVGFYTAHRWKLPTTSWGLLLVATLLVPLCFLVIVLPGDSGASLLLLACQVTALGWFAWMVYLAGKVLVSRRASALACGVMGASGAQTVINQLIAQAHTPSASKLLLLAILPVFCCCISVGWALAAMRKQDRLNQNDAAELLTLLGATAFAAALPLGLLVAAYNADNWMWTLQRMAPLLSLAGVPAMAGGLILWQRVVDRTLIGWRISGTAVAVIGSGIMLSGIAVAWPNPVGMLPAALLVYMVLTGVGLLLAIPLAHLLALPCLALAYILAFHLILPASHPHHIGWWESTGQLVAALQAPSTGCALVGLVALLWGAAEGWIRWGRPRDGAYYSMAGNLLACISLAIASIHGLGRSEDHGAVWVYGVYALVAIVLAWRQEKAAIAWIGSCLLALALIQGVAFRFPVSGSVIERFTLAMLLHATATNLLALLTAWASHTSRRAWSIIAYPARSTGLASSAVAAGLLIAVLLPASPFRAPLSAAAGYMFWLAAIWLAVAVAEAWPDLFTAFQVALSAAVTLAVAAGLAQQPGYAWYDPRTLQAQGIALAGLSLLWTCIRLGLKRFGVSSMAELRGWRQTAYRILYSDRGRVDRWLPLGLVAGLAIMAAYGAWPGIAVELSPGNTSIQAIASAAFCDQARGTGAWILAGSLVVVFAAGLWIEFQRRAVLAVVAVAGCSCLLLAGRWQEQVSTASAYRWLSAALLIAGSIPVWLRGSVSHWAAGRSWPGFQERSSGLSASVRMLLLALGMIPVLGITLYVAAQTMAHVRLNEPTAGSFFHDIGNAVNYVLPLAALLLGLVVYAIREHSAAFAFWGGVILNLTVTLGYVLWVITQGRLFAEGEGVRLLHVNAISAAAYGMAWLGFREWGRVRGSGGASTPLCLLRVQLGIALATLLMLLGPAEFQLYSNPSGIAPTVAQTGDGLGWLAWLLVSTATAWMLWRWQGQLPVAAICGSVLAAGSLVAYRFGAIGGGWLAYHVLLVSRVMAGVVMLGMGWLASLGTEEQSETDELRRTDGVMARWLGWQPRPEAITKATLICAMLAAALAFRAAWDDPSRPWWSVCGLAAVSWLGVGLALWTRRSGWFYPAGMLLNLAATIWWMHRWTLLGSPPLIGLVQVNAIVLATTGLAFLLLELHVLRPARDEVLHVGLAFHRPAAVLSVLAVSGLTCVALASDVVGAPLLSSPWLVWLSMLATVGLVLGCLWDPDAGGVIRWLCLLGLVVAGTVMDAFDLPLIPMMWRAGLVLAGYSVLVSSLHAQRSPLARLACALSMPRREGWPSGHPRWLIIGLIVQAGVVILIAGLLVMHHHLWSVRMALAGSVLAVAVAFGLLGKDQAGFALRTMSLLVGAISAIFWGWAWVQPHRSSSLLSRLAILTVAMAGVTSLYAVGLVKLIRKENSWITAAKELVPFMACGTVISLLLALGFEAALYNPAAASPGAPIAMWAFLCVVATMLGLAAAAVICAVVPGRDPLELPERLRVVYIYAAEMLLVLLFVHTKLCWPDLLNLSIWNRFWPLIIMGLAFAGVALSEVFRRQNRMVLAAPLGNSAAFLPILPVIAYFLLTRQWRHAEYVDYSVILLLAGLVYGLLAVLRRSFGFAVLAALAGNGALWYLLHHTGGLGFLQHPQIWLIPIAVSVIIAAQLNRDRLPSEQMKATRYICMMVIYVSSTADVWINGLDKAPWLALVLAALSAAGVMMGIVMRIQSYLFLGTLFLLVSIVAMIRYAQLQVHSWWPWLVSGIILGTAIVVLFALFEKKRTQLLGLVAELKDWE